MLFPSVRRRIYLYIVISIFFIIIAIFSSILIFKKANNIQKQIPIIIHLGISKSFFSIPIYIAKKLGYFKKEGINVKISEYSSGKLAMISMFNGKNDISTVADMPVIINSFKRNDFYILATFSYSYDMVKIITKKDSGIKTAKDLIGKRIGINPGTSSHFYLVSFLLYNLVPISKIKLINMKTIDMPLALKNNKVDAVSIWEPYTQKAINILKNNILILKAPDIYRTTFNFAAKKQFVKNNPEIIKQFLKAIDDAEGFINNNKEKSIEIAAYIFNIDRNTVYKTWNKYIFGLFLDESLLISWDSIARWEIEKKFFLKKNIPNYLNFLYLDALKEIKPESISLIY